jgi:hypothetical protein
LNACEAATPEAMSAAAPAPALVAPAGRIGTATATAPAER